MRRIVHISDIHFGREESAVVERLVEKVNQLEPQVVVVSGDLTQRARRSQFEKARAMLNRLPQPQIVVPGNHDVPLYDVVSRFFRPLERYKEHISEDLTPFYLDDDVAIAGINTARSLTIKRGRISAGQVEAVRRLMVNLPDPMLKIVVTHHPFDVPDGSDEDDIVGRAEEAMPLIAESGADVFLAGHLHVSHIGHSARRYRLESGRSALIVQAGTATSKRERGEENSFNLLEWAPPMLTVTRFQCSMPDAGFQLAREERFVQSQAGWQRV